MEKTKVLYIIDQLGAGGKERRLIQLLRGIDDNPDISARIVLLSDVIHYREVHDLCTEVIVLDRKIKKDPLVFFKIHRICKHWNPDIIHAWGSMPAIYAIPAAKLLKIKLINAAIADAPKTLSLSQSIRSRISFPFSDVIQSNSYAGLKAYDVPEGKGNVVHNGFDPERMKNLKESSSVRDELGIKTEFVIGMVAGFNFHKDYVSLIEAGSRITETRDDVTFVCIGDGRDYERIKGMTKSNDRIILTGRRNDVESIVNTFDIGVLLTDLSTHGEGISNSIMEYMAFGKPVIASDGGGTRELVVDGETGFLIPQRSPDILREKIELLLDDTTLRASMGTRGKEKIEREFSLDRMIEEHIDLYRKMLVSS